MNLVYLIDLFLVLIVLVCVMIHAKRGLWRTLQFLIVLVLSAAISLAWAYVFAKPVSEKWVAPTISDNVTNSIDSLDDAALSAVISEKGSSFLEILDRYHVDYQSFVDHMTEMTDTEQVDLKKSVADGIADAASYRIAFIAILTISFFLSLIILSIIFRIVGFLDRVPVLHGANHLLGGILGLIIGILLAFAAALLISYFSDTLTKWLPSVFVYGFREKTYLFRRLLSVTELIIK